MSQSDPTAVVAKLAARAKASPSANGTHPKPVSIPPTATIPEYRPFPLEHLAPVLREMVSGVAEAVGCDSAFAALPGLVVSAASVGAAVGLSSKRHWVEPCSLFGGVVAGSGGAKSPAADPLMKVADLVEDDLEQEHQDARASYDANLAAHTEDPERNAKPVIPKREYFVVTDCTFERLVENLSTSPRGLLVHRDELAGWLSSFTRYRSSGSDLPNWLSLFEAKPISFQRRTGTPRDVRVRRGVVSVFGGIQPDVLRTLYADPGFIHSGFAARMLVAMPPQKAVRWSETEVDPHVEAAFVAALRFLRSIPFDPKRPARVGMDGGAKAAFVGFTNEMADRTDEQDGGPMAATLPKLNRMAMRLALIHHCLRTASAEVDPGTQSMAEVSMVAGVALARWFGHEAERVFAMLGERPEDTAVRKLAELVRRKGGKITPRELMRSNERRYPNAQAAELSLDGLVSAGLGEWSEVTAPNSKIIRTLTLVPDARRCPTLTDAKRDTLPDAAPDGVPDTAPLNLQKQGDSPAVSGRVGRRAAHPDTNEVEGKQEAVSGRVETQQQFAARLAAVGKSMPDVVSFLNSTRGEDYPADSEFDDLLTVHKMLASEWLATLPPNVKGGGR